MLNLVIIDGIIFGAFFK